MLMGIACATFPIHASEYTNPDDHMPANDYFDIPLPAIEKTVQVGGFTLVVDREQVAYRLYREGCGNLLGEFRGDHYFVQVLRVSSSDFPIDKIAAKMDTAYTGNIHLSEVRGKKGLKGVRAIYEGKVDFFASHIHRISYFFVNKKGETICFTATKSAPNTDWSYVKYFIPETISPTHS